MTIVKMLASLLSTLLVDRMSLDTPHYKRAVEEADFLRDRLFHLQEKVQSNPDYGDAHIDYLHTLYALIDKEHSIYTRLHLIDSTESRRAIEKLDAYKIIDFLPKDDADPVTVHNIYPIVKAEIMHLIKEVSGDDWDPCDFDIEVDEW